MRNAALYSGHEGVDEGGGAQDALAVHPTANELRAMAALVVLKVIHHLWGSIVFGICVDRQHTLGKAIAFFRGY